MNTGKQINAMVIVLFLTLITLGAYAIWDPLRSETAEDEQLEMDVRRGATTFALNCRLCHGDRGQGGLLGGRLPQALTLDQAFLRGFEMGELDEELLKGSVRFVTDTIACGRVGSFMPTWGAEQGGTLSEEQIRQLTVLITGGGEVGFWAAAQEHADEIDAEATGHATVQMPGGIFGAGDTELVVNNAGPFSAGQYIRIRIDEETEERLHITAIPSTGQQLAEDIGRTPGRFLVSGAEGIEVGAISRLDGELMEVTAVRNDGDPGIVLDIELSASDARISVSDPAFFRPGYVVRVGDELIRVIEPVKTGQSLQEPIGRAETTFVVSGSDGLSVGMVIRMGSELLRITELDPAFVEVERISPAPHTSGTAILKADVEEDEEPDTGQTLLDTVDASDTTFVVSGTTGIAVDETFRLGDEVVTVTAIELARLRVERGIQDTDRAAHSRRVDIFQRNLLAVERGVAGAPAAHREGAQLFFATVEVARTVAGSVREQHVKGAELCLGHRLIVERGTLETNAADHPNGVLVLDFPSGPDDPTPNEEACGQRRVIEEPTATGPTATPEPTPLGAQQVAVSLTEFAIDADPATIADGPVVFQVTNDGAIDHNLRVIATDLPPNELPLSGGGVDEAQLTVVGSTPDFAAGSIQGVTVEELSPGNYVLICNVPGHYLSGMRVGFEVTTP